MIAFKDYNFLAKYARKDNFKAANQILAGSVVNELNVNSILDIGGGTTSYVCSLGDNVTTAIVDTSSESLDNVDAQMKITGALPNIAIQDGEFHFVSALEVIEHLDPIIYKESLLEISRISNQYVFITSPFLQDLSQAFVLCDNCGAVFQCEGHFRRFGLKEVESLQKYFGGIKDLYFIGPQSGLLSLVETRQQFKSSLRRFLQVVFKKKYCRPPFTKCPVCDYEIFNSYDEYLKVVNSTESNAEWWKWRDKRIVSFQFGVLFEKDIPHIQL